MSIYSFVFLIFYFLYTIYSMSVFPNKWEMLQRQGKSGCQRSFDSRSYLHIVLSS